MSKSTRTHTVDLTTERTDGGKQLKIDHHVFEVTRLDDTASVRIGDQDARPTELGDTDRFVAEDGQPFDRIWIDNPASDVEGATLEITIPAGYCRERSASGRVRVVKSAGGASFDPTRLEGDLAATTTIADGDEASEEVDTAGATALRVRARVSGTGGLDELSATADTEAQAPRTVAIDEVGERMWVAGDDTDAAIIEVDISDPENPAKTGTVSNADLENVYALAYDPTNDLLIAARWDLTNDNGDLSVIDVSTPGTPSHEGSVVISVESPEWMEIDPTRSLAFVAGQDFDTDEALAVVNYSAPAAPSVETHVTHTALAGLGIDVDRALLYVATGAALEVWSIQDPDGPAKIADVATSVSDGLLVDADRQLAWTVDDSETEDQFNVWDLSDRSDPSVRTVATIEVNGFSNRFQMVYAALDADNNFICGFANQRFWIVDVDDPDAPALIERIQSFDSGEGRPDVWSKDGEIVIWLADNTADEYVALGVELGSDQLNLYVTNPGGSRSTTKTPAAVTLEDGREAAVDMDLEGEGTIEVEIAARSGVQTNVDYVDVYRATG